MTARVQLSQKMTTPDFALVFINIYAGWRVFAGPTID
jgi:hypothetical protein